MSREAKCEALEQKHVHDVYNRTAHHFKDVRYKAWPKVKQFLLDLEPGAMVADVGCGNGKYLHINKGIFKLGSDHSSKLVNIAHDRHHEVMTCDNLYLPYRDNCFDAVISIGVIHHLTTPARRAKAVEELARIIRPGGKLMIYVWAMEQTKRNFDGQDVLVPWHFQPVKKKIKNKSKIRLEKGTKIPSSYRGDENNGPDTGLHNKTSYTAGSLSNSSGQKMGVCISHGNEGLDNFVDQQYNSSNGYSDEMILRRDENDLDSYPINKYDMKTGTAAVVSDALADGTVFKVGENTQDDKKTKKKVRHKLVKEERSSSLPEIIKGRILNLFGTNKNKATEQEVKEEGLKPKAEQDFQTEKIENLQNKDLQYKKLIENIMKNHQDILEEMSLCGIPFEDTISNNTNAAFFQVREFPQSSQRLGRQMSEPGTVSERTFPLGEDEKDSSELKIVVNPHEKLDSQQEKSENVFSRQAVSEQVVTENEKSLLTIPRVNRNCSSSDDDLVYMCDTTTDFDSSSPSRSDSSPHHHCIENGGATDNYTQKNSMGPCDNGTHVSQSCNGTSPKDGGFSVRSESGLSQSHGLPTFVSPDSTSTRLALNKLNDLYDAKPNDPHMATVCEQLNDMFSDVGGSPSPPNQSDCYDKTSNGHSISDAQSDSLPNKNISTIGSIEKELEIQDFTNGAKMEEPLTTKHATDHESDGDEWQKLTAKAIDTMQTQVLQQTKHINNLHITPHKKCRRSNRLRKVESQDSLDQSESGQDSACDLDMDRNFEMTTDGLCQNCSETDVRASAFKASGGLASKRSMFRSLETSSISSDAYSESSSDIEECSMCSCSGSYKLPNSNRSSFSHDSPRANEIERDSSIVKNKRTIHSETNDRDQTDTTKKEDESFFKRFYHVFREGELTELIEQNVECLHILEAYYDHANWCVIAEKVNVWTI